MHANQLATVLELAKAKGEVLGICERANGTIVVFVKVEKGGNRFEYVVWTVTWNEEGFYDGSYCLSAERGSLEFARRISDVCVK